MPLAWTPWVLPALLGGFTAWGLALVIFRWTPDRALGLRTSGLMLLEGAAVLSSSVGVILLFTSLEWFRFGILVHMAVDWLLFALYLPFLAFSLDVPALRILKRRGGEATVVFLALVGAAAVFLHPPWFLRDIAPFPPVTPQRWLVVPETAWTAVAALLGVMFLCSSLLSVQAWRRAGSELARRRARAFALAFGVRALVWGGLYLVVALAGTSFTPQAYFLLMQVYAGSLFVYAVLVGYGLLTVQLFDIDVRIKWTVRQSTVAGAFVAVFFLVSEGMTTLLSDRLGNLLGLVASAVLVFFLEPLRRVGDRVAEVAVPGDRSTPEYETFRKLQVYHTALEGAYGGGGVTDKERVLLDTLRSSLGISAADSQRLEADVRGRVEG